MARSNVYSPFEKNSDDVVNAILKHCDHGSLKALSYTNHHIRDLALTQRLRSCTYKLAGSAASLKRAVQEFLEMKTFHDKIRSVAIYLYPELGNPFDWRSSHSNDFSQYQSMREDQTGLGNLLAQVLASLSGLRSLVVHVTQLRDQEVWDFGKTLETNRSLGGLRHLFVAGLSPLGLLHYYTKLPSHCDLISLRIDMSTRDIPIINQLRAKLAALVHHKQLRRLTLDLGLHERPRVMLLFDPVYIEVLVEAAPQIKWLIVANAEHGHIWSEDSTITIEDIIQIFRQFVKSLARLECLERLSITLPTSYLRLIHVNDQSAPAGPEAYSVSLLHDHLISPIFANNKNMVDLTIIDLNLHYNVWTRVWHPEEGVESLVDDHGNLQWDVDMMALPKGSWPTGLRHDGVPRVDGIRVHRRHGGDVQGAGGTA